MSKNHRKHNHRHSQRTRAVFEKQHPSVGASPGTLVISEDASKPAVRLIQYNADHVREEEIHDITALAGKANPEQVTWIDIQGLGDEQLLRTIAEMFQLHPLELEDIVNVPQRPKVEAYNGNLLIVTRMAMLHDAHLLEMDQVSIVLGSHFVLTFQEHYGDVLDAVRHRIRQDIGIIRKSGTDHLAYAILDATIDGYYPVLESFGERLEDLEDQIIACARPQALHTVHDIKRELLSIRRGIWPLREAVNTLVRDEHALISPTTRMHLRDCYDHCVQIIDVVETYRELAGGLMDLYLSSIASRQNDIMRVLTVIATIFMPLTFLAGVYGMNFDYMPELRKQWAYPTLLAGMTMIAGWMLLYFGRKGWLRQQ